MSDDVTIWMAAISTFAIYSLLYRENRFFRLFEHIFVGLSVGFIFVTTWTDMLIPKWWEPMTSGKGWSWCWIFAAVIGTLWYFQYSRRHIWLSRVVMGLMMGAGAGMGLKAVFTTYMPQIQASFKPLNSFSNIVFVITLICVMFYFFFSFEQRNPFIRGSSKLGRYFLMVSFGAIFGSTVMARMSLFIERLQFLLTDWIKILD
jgi:hypothetical protein